MPAEGGAMNGWIKLHRGIRASWVWNNPKWLKWWLDLLLLAAWEDTLVRKRRRYVRLHRGEVCMSNRELQRRWGVESNSTIHNFIEMLEETGMLTKAFRGQNCDNSSDRSGDHKSDRNGDQKGDHFFRILTICNYALYQGIIESSATTLSTTTASTNPTRKATTKLRNKEYQQQQGCARARVCEGDFSGPGDPETEDRAPEENTSEGAPRPDDEDTSPWSGSSGHGEGEEEGGAPAGPEAGEVSAPEMPALEARTWERMSPEARRMWERWREVCLRDGGFDSALHALGWIGGRQDRRLAELAAEQGVAPEQMRRWAGEVFMNLANRLCLHRNYSEAWAHWEAYLRKKAQAWKEPSGADKREQARRQMEAESTAAIAQAVAGLRREKEEGIMDKGPAATLPLPSGPDPSEQDWEAISRLHEGETPDYYVDFEEI